MSTDRDQKIFTKLKQSQGFLSPKMSMKSLKDGVSVQELKKYFVHSYEIYEKLFAYLPQKSFYEKPEPLRHPLIFYYGHTAAFFINKLIDKGLIKQRIDPYMETVFAVGVDEMDWDDLDESHYDWPKLSQVQVYRSRVKQTVLKLISKLQSRISWESDSWVLLMGIEHQKIHLQTSSVIIRRIPIENTKPVQGLTDCPFANTQTYPQNQMVMVPECRMKWGRAEPQSADYYGWDNEFGEKQINVPQFSISTMLVSNGQYLEFVKQGGYANQKYWDNQGKAWIRSIKPKTPLFWIKEDECYYLKTMNQRIKLPLDWPAQVNNLQATAFCNWKSLKEKKKLRLPTEDEYMSLRELANIDHFDWKCGQAGNINMECWFSPNPVNMFETNGFYGIIGNVWQHCSTPIYPFKGFKIHPVYEDFTTPTFDGRHYMIKGGSFISCGNESFKHSRYAFRRHFHQFAGFRYVESEVQPQTPKVLIDECDQVVEQFLRLHFLEKGSYIQKLKTFIIQSGEFSGQNFLHVGCSIGSIVLQMSKYFRKSYGTDFSARFFQMATRILQKGSICYKNIKIGALDFNKQNIFLYQFNPLNPDYNKINGFKLILIDGLTMKQGAFKEVAKKHLPLLVEDSYLILVNCPSKKNVVSLEELKQETGAVVEKIKEQIVLISQTGSDKVQICLFRVNPK